MAPRSPAKGRLRREANAPVRPATTKRVGSRRQRATQAALHHVSSGPTFGVIRTKRIFEEICDQVRREVASGTLRPGDKLPAERDLAIRFGVSRPAVREALRSLEVTGVISLQKGVKGGAFVLKGDPDIVTRSLHDLYHLGGLSLADLTEARMVMMQSVVDLAAARMDEATQSALADNVARLAGMPASLKATERSASSADFYRLIARGTGNVALQIVVEALTSLVLLQVEQARPRGLPHLVAHRKRLLQHLLARDGESAKREIARHLKRLHLHLVRTLVI